jgi:filamentous hemagglutinin family protein
MNAVSRSGTNSRLLPKTRARPLALAIALLFASPALLAQPTGGRVVSGQASIGAPANGLMTINQTSQKAILNWQSFSIGVGEATHFQQPAGGVALNRVAVGNPSQILGTLTSTGQLFLVNPSGILFGQGAVLNSGGLVASTLDITDSDFLGGNYRFFNNGGAAAITNQGELSAYDGTYIALLAPEVRNEGLISARLGSVAIGAGDRVSLDLDGDNLIGLSVEQSALNGRIENKHAIHADGGQVILSARAAGSLVETVINNEGAIRANSVAERNGRIVLEGARFISLSGSLTANGSEQVDGGTIQLAADNVVLSGDIDASGRQGGAIEVAAQGNLIQTAGSQLTAIGSNGVGGRIHLQASNADAGAQVFLSGDLDAQGLMGGQVQVLGDTVTLAAADVRATGASLGGEILIGGGFQGAATGVAHSRHTGVNASTVLDASATEMGAGGLVVVWSDGVTAFAGQALAQGGARGGDGGLIEVSGKASVYFDGLVNAGPASGNGANGVFLLDPKNITISATAQSNAGYFDLADPTPTAGDQHGSTTLVFGVDQLLVLSPYDDNAATDAGAIYVYNTASGAMLSMLTGDQANDMVGSGGISTLYHASGYDYLISSPQWHASTGAVTWLDGAGVGMDGVVGAGNSLVGSAAGDGVGTALEFDYNNGNYNYAVASPYWNDGRGAVTFANGLVGVTGEVSSLNSLVGSQPGDFIGSGGRHDLDSGHFLVLSPDWNGGAGAVTFVDRNTGIVGEVSAINSLVGGSPGDAIGSYGIEDIYAGYSGNMDHYNYLVLSPDWDGGKGAVTFGSGETGVSGVVSAANSFVGDMAGDQVGSGYLEWLYDYNTNAYFYVINSPQWHDSAGALTWVDAGGAGFGGVVSASNSLVGANPGDGVGSGGFEYLDSDNYLVLSPDWGGGKGAVTFFNPADGWLTGEVDAQNSLVGSVSTDNIGSGGIEDIYDYNNNTYNYLVRSPNWNDSRGAVTFGDGTTGVSGVVSSGNSLVGDTASDRVGSGGIQEIYDYIGGRYVYLIKSPLWHSSAGAVTWWDGDGDGFGGVVSSSNSLVGLTANDQIGSGGYFALSSGNYLVRSPNWGGGAGAVTFLDVSTGVVGEVGAANSLVGENSTDNVGSGGVQSIYDNGTYNYLVLSPNWNGTFGAVTFGNGATGVSGLVSASNSFIGDQAATKSVPAASPRWKTAAATPI